MREWVVGRARGGPAWSRWPAARGALAELITAAPRCTANCSQFQLRIQRNKGR